MSRTEPRQHLGPVVASAAVPAKWLAAGIGPRVFYRAPHAHAREEEPSMTATDATELPTTDPAPDTTEAEWVLRWPQGAPLWGHLAVDHPDRDQPRFAAFADLGDPILQEIMRTHGPSVTTTEDGWCELRWPAHPDALGH